MEQNNIFGKNAVLEALEAGSRKINKILIAKGLFSDKKLERIIELAKQSSVVFQFVHKDKFKIYENQVHQGIVAISSPVEFIELEDFFELESKNQYKRLLILDSVEDPHNVGSIIRTCVCGGFDAVITATRRSAVINDTVEKTSAGAVNHIPIVKVNSLISAIEKLKNNDYWIIATDAQAKDNYFDVDYTDMNFALIVSSEGKGINKTLLKHSDMVVKIPMFHNFNSLNVSNAAAVIIYEAVRQILRKNV